MADIVNKVYTPAVQLCSQGPLPLVPRSERERGTSMKGTWEGWPVVYFRIWVACVSYFHYAYNKRDVSCTVKLCHLPTLPRGCPYIFSQFNPLNTGSPLIPTLTMAPSVSFLTDFDSILVCLWQRLYHSVAIKDRTADWTQFKRAILFSF